jgi:hypothetical protein
MKWLLYAAGALLIVLGMDVRVKMGDGPNETLALPPDMLWLGLVVGASLLIAAYAIDRFAPPE